jgi:hypothetical protein
VKDGGVQALGYFYYEEEPGRRSSAKLLTKDEARRISARGPIWLSHKDGAFCSKDFHDESH